jgi:hypothetical protein
MDIRLALAHGGIQQPMLKAVSYIIGLAIAVAVFAPVTRANAGMVSGVFTDQHGKPLANRQLHFENRVTEDLYLARTASDGSFWADLPAGVYALRNERGRLVEPRIRIKEGYDARLSPVHERLSTFLERPFNVEGVAPYVIETEAPATAHVPEVPISPPPAPPAAVPPKPTPPAAAPPKPTPPSPELE